MTTFKASRKDAYAGVFYGGMWWVAMAGGVFMLLAAVADPDLAPGWRLASFGAYLGYPWIAIFCRRGLQYPVEDDA